MTSKEIIRNAQDLLHRTYSLYADEELRNVAIQLNGVEKDLEVLEKLEKAIKIMVKKDILPSDIYDIIICKNYEAYKYYTQDWDKELVLNKEEFKLLKEVLENNK